MITEDNIKKLMLIGINCRRIREQAELTQSEFGKKIGCKQKTISDFELGRANNLLIYLEYIKLKKSI